MDPNPYEASEDALIGVRNNSASPVSTLTLSGAGIFGLEGDGICTFTFTGSGYCAANGASAGVDPFDYYGPTTTYTNITNSFSTGTVNFNPAILPGGTTYFSLEGLPTASLGGTVGTPTTFTVTYDGNGSTGGSVPVDGAAYPSGATVTVLGNTGNLVRVGSTFLGWNTAANGSGTGYVGGATFTMGSSNVTLYAQWSGSTVAPLSNIPTLNEWMLILLSGLLGWFSLVQLRRPIRNKQR
jgi:hypothetical protein